MRRNLTYFVSDVHLGLQVAGPADREARFTAFLKDIPAGETEALYLLGDIWDFWYEYKDVVPKGYTRVFAALQDLMDAGVKVYFFPGNHDIWTYRYFEELGMVKLTQPYVAEIGGKTFCLGHGDGLGPVDKGYKFLRGIFHNRFLQRCFSSLHPWFAFRLGNGWSKSSRLGKSIGYAFKGEEEPLYKFCVDFNDRLAAAGEPADFFIFGHYHCAVDMPVGEARLLLLRDWISVSNWMVFDAEAGAVRYVER
ncbi:MAG: UDP-2,3-diacylglucosamine diphosphatase [Bacteroidales bacterium]|nr:UDP-2,3-diacylglucosamine diphosphatase [Bacteroidales bacterium]